MSEDNSPSQFDQDRWGKLLDALDEKLQLGLLEHLRRVESYEFINQVELHITPMEHDRAYLQKSNVKQQLILLAQDAIGIKTIVIVQS